MLENLKLNHMFVFRVNSNMIFFIYFLMYYLFRDKIISKKKIEHFLK